MYSSEEFAAVSSDYQSVGTAESLAIKERLVEKTDEALQENVNENVEIEQKSSKQNIEQTEQSENKTETNEVTEKRVDVDENDIIVIPPDEESETVIKEVFPTTANDLSSARPLLKPEKQWKRLSKSVSSVVFENTIEHAQDIEAEDNNNDDDERIDVIKNIYSRDKYEVERRNQYRPRHKRILDRDYEEAIIHELDSDDDDDDDFNRNEMLDESESNASINLEPSQDSIKMKTDFLNNFVFPPFDEFAIQEYDLPIAPEEILKSNNEDVGKFVDPLTGEVLPSSESESVLSEPEEEQLTISRSSSSDLLPMPEFSNDNDLDDDHYAAVNTKSSKDSDDDALENILVEFQGYQVVETSGHSEKYLQTINQQQEANIIISDCLNDLFDEIHRKSETIQTDNELRTKCDKEKLINSLTESVDNYWDETFCNGYLNTRTVEFHKRQKKFRNIIEQSPEEELQEYRRYSQALYHLDNVRKRNAESKRHNAHLMCSVLMDLQFVETIVEHVERHLEKTMRQYLVRNNSEYLRKILDGELRLMQKKRNEISDARLFLITRKHTLGHIKEKIKKLDSISDDLCIHDFIAIQNEVLALDKKLEERTVDLKKLLNIYNINLHGRSQNLEKSEVLAEQLDQRKSILVDLKREQDLLREKLYEAKMQRSDLHQKQNELSFRGGILSMPALLHDYDATVEKVKKTRNCVTKLKEILKSVSGRIEYYESRDILLIILVEMSGSKEELPVVAVSDVPIDTVAEEATQNQNPGPEKEQVNENFEAKPKQSRQKLKTAESSAEQKDPSSHRLTGVASSAEPPLKGSGDRLSKVSQKESGHKLSVVQEPDDGEAKGTLKKQSHAEEEASVMPIENTQELEEYEGVETRKSEQLTDEEKKKLERQNRKERVNRRFGQSSTSAVGFDVVPEVEDLAEDDDDRSDVTSVFDSDYDERNRPSYRHKSLLERNILDTVVERFGTNFDENLSAYGSSGESDQELWQQISANSLDTVQMKTDFLNDFEVPVMSDISESEDDPMSVSVVTAVSSIMISHGIDVGVFVNPLTGDVLYSSQSSADELPVEKVEEEMALSETSSGMLDFDDSDEAPKEIAKAEDEQARADSFVNFQQFRYIGSEEDSSDEDQLAKSVKNEVHQITNDFLEELLNEVITKSELLTADNMLRTNCDKNKLIEGIFESIENYEMEKSLNLFLNARTCEYYKRQRIHRVFQTLPPAAEYYEHRRYKQVLNHLDFVKKQNAEAKRNNAKLMCSVLMDLQYATTFVKHSELHLEHTMRHHLIRNNSDSLKRIVDRELKTMKHKRNEISDARLFLITRKHSLARISDKIHQLEKVTEDLLISDFVAIQNQVLALDKKIEERNVDLKKLLNTHQVELHQIEHTHEKALVLADMLEEEKSILRTKQERQMELRESLYEAKMQRTRIQQRHKELSIKGGILSMPALMTDYDVTLQRVEEKRVSVAKLRESLKSLSARVAYFESRNL
ncbi:putative leucine-rich repeat-containing protein DDB_G0290503 [Drosophila tropicalis]|uniref:putative leucine-rich repeat-containing protein DDB_G0290503 n=1 Tax=Drosophila tropicalis TaxID=46794 RepID=UPI0035AB7B9E